MKTLTYEYDKMVRAGQLLNSLVVSGSNNFRALAELANILDSGTPGETFEKEVGKDDSVNSEGSKASNIKNMDEQKIQPNKLAK